MSKRSISIMNEIIGNRMRESVGELVEECKVVKKQKRNPDDANETLNPIPEWPEFWLAERGKSI